MDIPEAKNKNLYAAILIALKRNNKSESDIHEVTIGQKFIIEWDEFKKIIHAMKPFRSIYTDETPDSPFIYNCDITLRGPDLYMECYFDEDKWDLSYYKTFIPFPTSRQDLEIGEAMEDILEELFLVGTVKDIYILPDIHKSRRLALWYTGRVIRFKFEDNEYSIYSDGNLHCLLYKSCYDELIVAVNQEEDGIKAFDTHIGALLRTDVDVVNATRGKHRLFRLEFDKHGRKSWYIDIDCPDGHKITHVLQEEFLPNALEEVIRKYL